MFRRVMAFGACLAMASGPCLFGATARASQQDECVSVAVVGSGIGRKIVVSDTCNRPTKQVQIYCGFSGGYVTSRLVRAWPSMTAETPCYGRDIGYGKGITPWCYLIEPANNEHCL